MQRYFLQLSFSGKNYHGWQLQANAHSVQAEINSALSTLLKAETETTGCGRTDTGVHAKIFFAHFETESAVEDVDAFVHHLNCIIPKDIAFQHLIKVNEKHHARFAATSRTYQYHIHQNRNPFLNDSSYYFPFEVNIEKMNEAAQLLIGMNDFSAFSKSRTQVNHFNCHITEAFWRKENDQLVFQISADRFLRNMVRAIVGTLLEVGEGKISVDDFKKVIEGKSRSKAGVSVPAQGLFLVDIKYPFV